MECARCHGPVVVDQICAHPSGVTVDYGHCVRCGAELRRITYDRQLTDPPSRWVEIVDETVSQPATAGRGRRSSTRPPHRAEKHRSARRVAR